jgi:hypothetical protein
LRCGILPNSGSVPEVLRNGVSGWICDSVEQMVAAVPRIAQLDRSLCRREAQRFASSTMCAGYERVYADVLKSATSGGN